MHPFSDNYNKLDKRSTLLIRILYRLKKYQYIFYKHFLLHGLNLSLALYSLNTWYLIPIPEQHTNANATQLELGNNRLFRLYWLLLNTSYVMEFFLQTLVKKNYLLQSTMLYLQQLLMFASTCVAIFVLQHVKITLAFLSFFMNMINRKYDFSNICIIFAFALLLQSHT